MEIKIPFKIYEILQVNLEGLNKSKLVSKQQKCKSFTHVQLFVTPGL